MSNWNVRAWGAELYFTCEVESRDKAIDAFFDDEPEHMGLFIEAFEDGTPVEDRTLTLTTDELMKRHMITNKDAAKVLNDMGLDAMPNERSYKLFKENARWFKENAL